MNRTTLVGIIGLVISLLVLPFFAMAQYPPPPLNSALSGGEIVLNGNVITSSNPINSGKPINPEDKNVNKTKRLNADDELWSERKICDFTNGCASDKCYPFGYIKEGLYCAGSKQGFVKQQYIHGETCSYDFQCTSNFCFNNQCVSNYQALIREVLTRLYTVENKLELDLKEIETDVPKNEIVVETLEIKENKFSGFFKRLFR